MAKSDILINVLLDRSGSMGGYESDVIGHYNKFIEEQRALPGTARVSLVLFDTQYEEVYIDKNINTVQPLDKDTYFVRGSTAYLDALGRLIKTVDAIKNKPAKVMFVINTDGLENASREYSLSQIKELVEERQNNHDWQFAFVSAGLDKVSAQATTRGMGINLNSMYAAPSAAAGGIEDFYTVLGSSTTDYRSGATLTLDMADAGAKLDEEKKKVKKPTTK